MSKWLFGPSRLNNADFFLLVVLLVLYDRGEIPWWAGVGVFLPWIVASVFIEQALFGPNYHSKKRV